MYMLLGAVRLDKVDPQAWLADLLARIADHPATGSMSCCPGTAMTSLPPRLQQLEARLTSLTARDEGPMLLSELDGFIAGILVCSDMIMPSEWLPIIFGDDGGMFESKAAMHDCVQLVLGHYNSVGQDLQRVRHGSAPGELDGGGSRRCPRGGGPDRGRHEGAHRDHQSRQGLGSKEDRGSDRGRTQADPRLGRGPERPAPMRSNKVGRNEPCPCGSGKKCKKCCGLNDDRHQAHQAIRRGPCRTDT